MFTLLLNSENDSEFNDIRILYTTSTNLKNKTQNYKILIFLLLT